MCPRSMFWFKNIYFANVLGQKQDMEMSSLLKRLQKVYARQLSAWLIEEGSIDYTYPKISFDL
jgi:hypothetical protein